MNVFMFYSVGQCRSSVVTLSYITHAVYIVRIQKTYLDSFDLEIMAMSIFETTENSSSSLLRLSPTKL